MGWDNQPKSFTNRECNVNLRLQKHPSLSVNHKHRL